MNISLILTDASPLITLAVADELDTLLLPGVLVIVPDMVRFEVTRQAGKPGAQKILDWIRARESKMVSVRSTEVFEEYEKLLSIDPSTKSKNRGEESAGEILGRELNQGIDAAILLFEDSDVKKSNFLVRMPDNVLVMSTSTFLDGLERTGLIPDANAILLKAVTVRGEKILEREVLATEGAEELNTTWMHSMRPR